MISGLGADKRIFKYLDFGSHSMRHIEWIDPNQGESLPNYAHRLSAQIDQTKPFALAGLSFGGMLAQEIARELSVKRLFVISSIRSADELPWYLKVAGGMELHHKLPLVKLRELSGSPYSLFGVKEEKHRELLNEIMEDMDVSFVRWAFDAILNWKPQAYPEAIRIHGTKDKILPLEGEETDLLLDGGHLLTATHCEEVSEFMRERLDRMEGY